MSRGIVYEPGGVQGIQRYIETIDRRIERIPEKINIMLRHRCGASDQFVHRQHLEAKLTLRSPAIFNYF